MKPVSAYEDLLYLPHPVSKKHPAIPVLTRAAQFAAFKALTGYEEEIAEEGRYTEQAMELDESRKEILDRRIRLLWEHRADQPMAEFICFEPDERKAGGRYRCIRGVIQKLDPLGKTLILHSGESIPVDALCDLRADLFSEE